MEKMQQNFERQASEMIFICCVVASAVNLSLGYSQKVSHCNNITINGDIEDCQSDCLQCLWGHSRCCQWEYNFVSVNKKSKTFLFIKDWSELHVNIHVEYRGPFILKWVNFNPSMEK